ncbi:MAG: FAD-dependent oxidoreductase [Bdellovibrio sp.]
MFKKSNPTWTVHKVLNRSFSRREALKFLGLSSSAFWLSGCSSLFNSAKQDDQVFAANPQGRLLTADGRDFSPIDRNMGSSKPRTYSGDNPDRAHEILWNKASYIASRGGIPTPTEKVPMVIVGGGMSGIISGYLLRKHKPVILERADRFGGNSRGESWQGIDYSIGAAYFMEQDPGSPIFNFYQETGINKLWTVKKDEDPLVYNNKRIENFWEGGTAPKYASQFKKLNDHFKKMFHHDGLVYPDMPTQDANMLSYVKELDKETFIQYLQRIAGGKLHPHIETALEHFCWSTVGSSISEISAASGLNQYVSEFGDAYVTPGGNSAVAEKVLQLSMRENPTSNFRPSSVVVDVQRVEDGVVVAYEDSSGKFRSIHAKAVIMACPKYVVKHVLNNIEPARLSAISKLRYTPYLVANVLIDGAVKDSFYDLFLLGDGKVNLGNIVESAQKQKTTDVILGTYAKPDKDRTVLTLYRSLPYTQGRGQIYNPNSYDIYHQEFEQQIQHELLPLLGISKERVQGLRLSRWGHPMPVPVQGLIADGTIDEIRKPFAERVFFVEQDNWLLPCLETATQEALNWAPEVEKVLLG